ncbi:hypothetical protein DFH08DRAFT_1000227 [Mycena albidolilacea]|uniref:MACPF domain-containing protein n=1 Tax=Mycena albidolilacea TaxID=1033008 RepID=A0AAD7A2Y8_9AGAR|nr:hypothetical protein DFH08DRAFT_1000227 [Mycena albidolilacea]
MPGLGSTVPLKELSEKGVRILNVSEPSVVLPNALSLVAEADDGRRNQLQEIYSKAAQRVRRHVAFDDTPGVEQTTSKDTESTASLLLRYKTNHFTDIYPNVILLVAEWASIKPDAHNESAAFTSAIGKTLYALYSSNLVDEQRSNVVVVVTKSLSSLHEFDDYKTMNEKYAQWRIEEGRRRGVITDLQRKMFARSSPWEIVFIENGGGSDMSAKFPVLPDGLLSHQNLYDAICDIIKRPSSDGSLDLVGIQALQMLTGAGPSRSLAEARNEVLIGASQQNLVKHEKITTKPLPQSPDLIMQERASNYLGMTYDNAVGTFGCTNVLEEQNIDLRPVTKRRDFERMVHPLPHRQTGKLNYDRLRSHYSSDWAFHAAVSSSQCHILHCESRVITASNPRLSADMKALIGRLPPWSRGEQPKYTQFFKNYGTHVITQLVLGGTVRAIVDSTKNPNIMIFRDGGASVAAELTVYLEQNFPTLASSSGWKETREKWIQALEKEPVFCPDHELTQYKPIYDFAGLTSAQRADLARAYREYVASRPQNDKTSARKVYRTGHDSDWLRRDRNLEEAVNDLVDAVTQALYRTYQGR